jgi:hypothetical protein
MATTGKRYNKDLTTKQIAAIVRAELRDEIKAGKLPGVVSASVRYSHFAGGSAIDVVLTLAPGVPSRDLVSNAVQVVVCDKLDDFNWDDSDIMSDYFATNFYRHVSVKEQA